MIKNIQTAADIRLRNFLRVVNCISQHKEITRRSLADILDISIGTISYICTTLLNLKICEEDKIAFNLRGPKTKILRISTDCYYVGVLDLHRMDNACFLVLQLDKSIVKTYHIDYWDDVKKFYIELKKMYSSIPSVIKEKIIGITVPISGTMHKKTNKIFSSSNKIFEGVNVQSQLEKIFQVSTVVENESVICARTAFSFIQKKVENGIYIFGEEGLGISIMMDNTIVEGDNGFGSDVCTMVSPYVSKRCSIETVLSEKSKYTTEIKGKTLGYVISQLINILDINTFYIGGSLAYKLECFSDYINEVLEQYVLYKHLRDLKSSPDFNDKKTILQGGIDIALQKWIISLKGKKL